MIKKLLDQLQQIIKNKEQAALCTVVQTNGSAPLKAGAKMIVWLPKQNKKEIGEIKGIPPSAPSYTKLVRTYGTVGGGALEESVITQAKEIILSQKAHLFDHQLVKDHNMCCGGTVLIYIEPVPISHQLYIFGAGHIGKALSYHAVSMDFDVTIIDDRSGIFFDWDKSEFKLINKNVSEAIDTLNWDARTFVVIATYSHPLDREILECCIKKQTGYIGMIGSRRKVIVTRKLFLKNGLATLKDLDKIDMPIGMDINAISPHEIAVSIIGRLIQIKNNLQFESPGFWQEVKQITNNKSQISDSCSPKTHGKRDKRQISNKLNPVI